MRGKKRFKLSHMFTKLTKSSNATLALLVCLLQTAGMSALLNYSTLIPAPVQNKSEMIQEEETAINTNTYTDASAFNKAITCFLTQEINSATDSTSESTFFFFFLFTKLP